MSESLESSIRGICGSCGNDRGRLMDIVRAVQEQFGCVDGRAMELIAAEVGARRVEVEGVVSFYAFLSEHPTGEVVIRVSKCVPCLMNGARRVAEAFAEALGIEVGQTTADGRITLEYTPCIGMCDQAS